MSNSKDFKEKFVKFISGKGFYAVLAVCLIGAGTATWVAVDRTIDSIDENNRQIAENATSSKSNDVKWDYEYTEEARKNKDDIKVEENSSKVETAKPEKENQVSDKADKVDKKEEEESKEADKKPQSPALRPEPLTFVMPVEGDIITQFSNGKLVKDPTLNEWKTHNGVDIKASEGSAVVAVTTGKITKISKDKLWGSIIEVTHSDNTVAYYCGVEPINNIKEGDTVRQKQQIGKTIKIPCEVAAAPHIHFGMKLENEWINPLKHMGMQK